MKNVDLKKWFSHVRVVNLDKFCGESDRYDPDCEHTTDRWGAFQEKAKKAGFTGFERERAIEGDLNNPPVWWRAGNGAWGCLMTHLRIAQDAIADGGQKHLLVFEDDCVFKSNFSNRLQKIMDEVGDDWDMLYLGGQHLEHHGKPWREEGQKEVINGFNINRTHAFAVNRRFLVKYAQHIIHAPDYIDLPGKGKAWHIDHQLGNLHEPTSSGGGGTYKILAAHPWICGQDAGVSWTSGRKTGKNWWDIKEHQIMRK